MCDLCVKLVVREAQERGRTQPASSFVWTFCSHVLGLTFILPDLALLDSANLNQKDPWVGLGGSLSWLHLRVASYSGVTSQFSVIATG